MLYTQFLDIYKILMSLSGLLRVNIINNNNKHFP